jgi:hypothetical protein
MTAAFEKVHHEPNRLDASMLRLGCCCLASEVLVLTDKLIKRFPINTVSIFSFPPDHAAHRLTRSPWNRVRLPGCHILSFLPHYPWSIASAIVLVSFVYLKGTLLRGTDYDSHKQQQHRASTHTGRTIRHPDYPLHLRTISFAIFTASDSGCVPGQFAE